MPLQVLPRARRFAAWAGDALCWPPPWGPSPLAPTLWVDRDAERFLAGASRSAACRRGAVPRGVVRVRRRARGEAVDRLGRLARGLVEAAAHRADDRAARCLRPVAQRRGVDRGA